MGISLNPSTLLNGQGIDVSSLVQQVLSNDSGELTTWQNELSTLQTQASDITSINGDLNSLATAVQALADPLGAITSLSATSSDNTVLTATANTSASAGTDQVVVNNLATSGTIYTNDFVGGANTSILPSGQTSGEIDLDIGGTVQSIAITAGSNDTLTTLASYINSQNLGVTASVVTDANGSRLALASQSTGTAGTLGVTGNTTQLNFANLTSSLSSTDFAGGANTSILASGQTTGEIDLQIGGTTQAINITAGSNDTLTTLANYINNQNLGVTASVSTDANGAELNLVSQSGSAVSVAGNTTQLNFAANGTGGTNASLTINGVPYSSASNTITGAIPGVTLNLTGANPNETVQVSVGADSSAITDAINNFVSAYNQVIGDINQQYTINSSTNSEGPLGPDSSLRDLQTSLLADAAYALPLNSNGGYTNLTSLGIATNNDGTLTVDSSQLASVLASNPSAVQNFFQNSTSTGFANNFNTDVTNQTNPTTGPLNVDLAQNNASQQDLTTNINNFETQLQAQQTQLTSEFDQVNASLQAYPLLLEQTTEVLGTLDSGSSSTSTSDAIPTLTSGL
jgi:flagellar hook-associated protein 2